MLSSRHGRSLTDMDLAAGLVATHQHQVNDDDTAIALGSGDVAVLATPRLLAWLEAATVAAVSGRLADGTTSVGTVVELEHRVATPVGGAVTTRAELVVVDGRKLRFDVSAEDGEGRLVAAGTVLRVVVDRARFLGGG